MKIYYITRTFSPFQKGGGPLMRTGAVEYLQKLGWDVQVVMPAYRSITTNRFENIIQIPTLSILRLTNILQKYGLIEDYLDIWVLNAYHQLKSIVKKEDILFATTGGELGTLKLATLLKNKIGCKIVFNFRDPLVYALCHGKKIDNKFHVSRERLEKKYIYKADLIITSSDSYRNNLIDKYSDLSEKIYTNYFGYIEAVELKNKSKKKDEILRICYMGTMTSAQKPEILIDAYNSLKEKEKHCVQIIFIGDYKNYIGFNKLVDIDKDNIVFLDYMPRKVLLKYMIENIDVGFVSLTDDYYGACVPSKIYEYINLGLPILAALPDGDGLDIVNNNKYGKGVHYTQIVELKKAIKIFLKEKFISSCKENILKDKIRWSMDNRINDLNILLNKLVDCE